MNFWRPKGTQNDLKPNILVDMVVILEDRQNSIVLIYDSMNQIQTKSQNDYSILKWNKHRSNSNVISIKYTIVI